MILNYKKGSLILLSGIPGSGKSTFCRKYFSQTPDSIISSDELRERYFGRKNVFFDDGSCGEGLYQSTGKEIFDIMKILAKKRCELGLTTVIDSTNLADKQRQLFIELGAWTEVYTIIFDEEVGMQNNALRKTKQEFGYVDTDIMNHMLERFEKRTSLKGNHIINAIDIEGVHEELDSMVFSGDVNVLVWGDTHGVKDLYATYHDLQKKYEKNGNKPFQIFLGDIVDRGDYSVENLFFILKEISRGNASLILGNHDKKLLENLLIYKETGDISENIVSRFMVLKKLITYFQGENTKLHIPELEKNNNLNMVIEALTKANYYKVLHFGDKKYLMTHAPVLLEDNLGHLLKEECIYGCEKFGSNLVISNDEKRKNNVNYLTAVDTFFQQYQTKMVCGHFDLARLQEELGIGTGLISLEGEVDNGGFFKVLVLENNEGKVTESVLKFPSHLTYVRDEHIGELQTKLATLDKRYYNKKSLGSLSIYKYSKEVFYDNLWNKNNEEINVLLLQLRGLVLDVCGNVISYPFDKIFNYGEKLTDENNNVVTENKVNPDDEYIFVEKMNGFLGIISPHPYKEDILLHTSGSFTGDYINYMEELLSKKQKKRLIELFAEKKLTLCFEVISQKDPHIIPYSDEEYGLYLIGARNISSNDMRKMSLLSEEELDDLGNELGFRRPKYFVSTLTKMQECIGNSKIEGYILRTTDTQVPVIKIKTPYYLVTKFLSRMGHARFEQLFKSKEQFIKNKNIDEEFYPLLDYIIENKDVFLNKDSFQKADYIRAFLNK